MISMSGYNITEDNLEDFLNKQGYTLYGWGDSLTKAIRHTNVLEMWGFIDREEAQRIYNRITIRVMLQAQEIKDG